MANKSTMPMAGETGGDAMGGDMGEMDSLYGGAEGSEKEEASETTDQEKEEETANTAVVPVKVLMGSTTEPLKEGEEVVVKVVKVYGDEAEIAYSTTKPGEIPEYGKTDNDEIDQMSDAGESMGY